MICVATLLAAYVTMRDVMRELHETGRVGAAEEPHAFDELLELLGVDEALERARKHA